MVYERNKKEAKALDYYMYLGHLKLIVCFVPECFLICMRACEKHNTDCEKIRTIFLYTK